VLLTYKARVLYKIYIYIYIYICVCVCVVVIVTMKSFVLHAYKARVLYKIYVCTGYSNRGKLYVVYLRSTGTI